MEDFEAIVSPFAMAAHRKQMQERLENIELTDQEKAHIIRLASLPEYGTLLKLMEGEIIKAETDHFKVWKDPVAFERSGLVAVAQRLFFERIQVQIARRFEEVKVELDRQKFENDLRNLTPEDLIQNSI